MADDSTKPIEDIELGDQVLVEDPETGVRGNRSVTALWVHDDELVDLRIDGDTVTTTEDHPFWNASDREWQEAQEIDPGDRVLTADGEEKSVEGMDWSTRSGGIAYNLTVADLHTYFVVVGEDEVLVHNTCRPEISTAIDPYRQARHVRGTAPPDKGYFESASDAQKVLDDYHEGVATVVGETAGGGIIVRTSSVTGYNVNVGAGYIDQPTNTFVIKGTSRVSIYPTSPTAGTSK